MPLWPQSSGPSSRSSSAPSATWEILSHQFGLALQEHEATLTALSQKLQTSEASGKLLSDSLTKLSQQNSDLRNYNEQMGQRMQERDADLADAYDAIDRKDKLILRLIIAVIAMGGVLAAGVVLWLRR
jgi:chromosome segregation ATPase